MFKNKKSQPYDVNDLIRDVDVAISEAQAAFIHTNAVVKVLETRAAALRARQALSICLVPQHQVVGGWR